MSMSDFQKWLMVCHQSPSESLFWSSAVLFDPGEGTTCVPL